MTSSEERQYLKRRALKERSMAATAACVEAALVHGALEQHYVKACAACEHGRTDACADCEMQAHCEAVGQ